MRELIANVVSYKMEPDCSEERRGNGRRGSEQLAIEKRGRSKKELGEGGAEIHRCQPPIEQAE